MLDAKGLEAAIDAAVKDSPDGGIELDIGAAITAYLQAVGPEPAVAVKPLEWAFRETKISDDLSVWGARAEGLDFTYSIWGSTNENATAAFTVPKLHNGFFDTLEAAKAAAQADYASRIRSALVATPPAERVVTDEMVDDAKLAWDGPEYIGLTDDMRKVLVAVFAAKPAVKDDETVVALPPTREYVDRIVRIFRDRPADDTSAVVLQDYARAALSGSGSGWPVPDGWKLVPVEPDDAMIEAGQDTCEEKNSWGGRVYASDIWESMLAASPAAPQQGGE